MISSFQFAKLPLIHFGKGELSGHPVFRGAFGKEILLVTGKSSFINSRAGADLMSEMIKNKLNIKHVIVPSEPSPEIIDTAVLSCRYTKPDVVVAIGGGSVMDAGKAISAMITVGGNVTDYLEVVGSKEHPGTRIPLVTVPTTSGTGSEATKNAVISQTGRDGFKRSLRHDNFVPDIALIYPELTISCPSGLTAASGMDCFTQLVESYLSVKAGAYTDALALEGLKAVKDSLIRSFTDGEDIQARTGMSFAALTSGICLANAGLGAVHGFASSLGALYDIPHGVICGTLMGASNELNVRLLRKSGQTTQALKKYLSLGKLFLDVAGKTDDYYIDGFIEYLDSLTSVLQLPGLKEAGVKKSDLIKISHTTDPKNNPVALSGEEYLEILEKRFT